MCFQFSASLFSSPLSETSVLLQSVCSSHLLLFSLFCFATLVAARVTSAATRCRESGAETPFRPQPFVPVSYRSLRRTSRVPSLLQRSESARGSPDRGQRSPLGCVCGGLSADWAVFSSSRTYGSTAVSVWPQQPHQLRAPRTHWECRHTERERVRSGRASVSLDLVSPLSRVQPGD